MILYHGTSYETYCQIVLDGRIKTATLENSPYRGSGSTETTYGNIYLTTSLAKAIEFANRGFIQYNYFVLHNYSNSMPRSLVVLRVELDDSKIEKDKDEERIGDSSATDCFQYNSDIDISKALMIQLDFLSRDDCERYYSNLTEDTIKALKWRKCK